MPAISVAYMGTIQHKATARTVAGMGLNQNTKKRTSVNSKILKSVMHCKNLRCCTFNIIVILFVVGCAGHEMQGHGAMVDQSAVIPYDPLPSRSASPIEAGVYSVVRVVDGDTLIVGEGV